MRVAITGACGFLGWHTACRLKAARGIDVLRLGRGHFAEQRALEEAVAEVDVILHIAGVNRAATSEQVEQGNIQLAQKLAAAVSSTGRSVDVVFANSVQAELDTPYGRGKTFAAQALADAVRKAGGRFADVLLPNLFGEHGRPHYNSFVATFVHEVAAGRVPEVAADREIPLQHVQAAAQALLDGIGTDGRVLVDGEPVAISEILRRVERIHQLYFTRGEIPPLVNDMDIDLFNTYRAATFPDMWPMMAAVHSDARGDLFETVRAHGGTGQSFISTTRPGQVRGNHYHLRKVERFTVVKGNAEIRLRRLLSDDVVSFELSGEQPAFVDMPTMWVHSIRNVGTDELVTAFWGDQLLDLANPDQYPEDVDLG